MSRPTRELGGVSIVLVGSFNPAIFHPAWFRAEGLLAPGEAEGANVAIIHADLASFGTEWLQLQVTGDQFVASTTREPYELLRDLVVGTFDVLSHTPVTKMGINRDSHWTMPSEDEWNSLGWRFAPQEPWEGVLKRPGLLNVTVQDVRPDKHRGYVRVKVEPSARFPTAVYVHVNDHYEAEPSREPEMPSEESAGEPRALGAASMMQILRERWADSLEMAENIEQAIIRSGERGA